MAIKKLRKHKASLTVEAALVTPVFVLALLPFLFILRFHILGAVVEDAMQDIMHELQIESYVLIRGSLLGDEDGSEESAEVKELREKGEEMSRFLDSGLLREGLQELALDLSLQALLYGKMKDRLEKFDLESFGVRGGMSGLSFAGSRFFFEEEGRDFLIRGELSAELLSPVSFFAPPPLQIVRTVRVFAGIETAQGSQDPGDENEKDTVYRIGSGRCYHVRSCYLIDKTVVRMSKTEALSLSLARCQRCGGGNSEEVYMSVGGGSYHAYACGYLFPDLEEISLEEAVGQGLMPCGLCFGSGGHFVH